MATKRMSWAAAGLVVLWATAARGGSVTVKGFTMPTGASDGYLLTSDAAGVGTWRAFPAHDHFGASWTGSGAQGLSVTNTATSGTTYGVRGEVSSSGGWAGHFSGGKGLHANRVAINTTDPADGYELYVKGDLGVTGAKNFVQEHPNDPTKAIVYVALEGPEAGTYIRGTAELRDGEARVELPEHFALVTNADGVTATLTPVGGWLQLYVAEQTARHLVVREASGKSGRFNYLVQGVRKGYEDHQVIRDRTIGPRDVPPQVSHRTERQEP